MIYIILIEPENNGNVGAIARVMKNFNFENLVLINPKIDLNSNEIKCRAKHAQDILSNVIVTNFNFLDKLDLIIGTTSKLGCEYNIPRVSLNPDCFENKINFNQNIGIIFGRESIGLTNEEITICDILVNIETNRNYSALNLSHAVAIILYTINSSLNKEKKYNNNLANKKYKNYIFKLFLEILNKLDFKFKSKKITQINAWKRIFGKSQLTKREAFIVFGLFKKINEKLKK
ncbi:MAG: RNA methyltransferase [Nanoarchaeota archaeon]